MTVPATETDDRFDCRHLMSDDLWERMTNRLARDEGMDLDRAQRIMNEVLRFLLVCAHGKSGPYFCNRTVDVGWHTFILYTKDYAEFCERVAGRFLHHTPDTYGGRGNTLDTVAAIVQMHGAADLELWGIRLEVDAVEPA